MPTGIIGLRGVGEFNTDFRPTNYRELYTFLEPNGDAPFNALLAMTASEATDDPKYNNFRDEMPERVMKVNNNGGYDASTAALTIDSSTNATFVVPGTLVVNSRTGEVMRASANGTATTLTVTRNIGGTSFIINDDDDLFIAGHAARDGTDTPNPVSFDAVVAYNYTQIFRTAFSVTNTLANTYIRTGDKEDEYATKALKLHMSDIERAMFFGRRHEDTSVLGSTSQPIRYTGGLYTTISNVEDVSSYQDAGVMTEDEFDRFLIENVFAFGSKEKLVFGGAKIAGHLQKFGKNRWQPAQVDGTYGVSVVRYTTMAGDLMFNLHPQFRQVPGMANAAVFLDLPYLKYRYLQNRDTQLLKDRQGNGTDGKTHEYLTECGLELLQDKVHTIIKGWDAVTPAP